MSTTKTLTVAQLLILTTAAQRPDHMVHPLPPTIRARGGAQRTLLGALRGHEDDRDSLLAALATVAPRGEARDIRTIVGGTPPGPLVLITGRLDEEEAGRLSTTGAAAPLLFAVDPAPGAIAAATRRGWHAAGLDPAGDLAEIWHDALPTFGVSGV